MKVFVYYNLHRKCWSVKALQGVNKGRVIAHEDELYLTNCTFKVSEAGRQRVLREKKKNVHAGVVGYLSTPFTMLGGISVTYNPYKYSSFVDESHRPIFSAAAVHMIAKDKVIVNAIRNLK